MDVSTRHLLTLLVLLQAGAAVEAASGAAEGSLHAVSEAATPGMTMRGIDGLGPEDRGPEDRGPEARGPEAPGPVALATGRAALIDAPSGRTRLLDRLGHALPFRFALGALAHVMPGQRSEQIAGQVPDSGGFRAGLAVPLLGADRGLRAELSWFEARAVDARGAAEPDRFGLARGLMLQIRQPLGGH